MTDSQVPSHIYAETSKFEVYPYLRIRLSTDDNYSWLASQYTNNLNQDHLIFEADIDEGIDFEWRNYSCSFGDSKQSSISWV